MIDINDDDIIHFENVEGAIYLGIRGFIHFNIYVVVTPNFSTL